LKQTSYAVESQNIGLIGGEGWEGMLQVKCQIRLASNQRALA